MAKPSELSVIEALIEHGALSRSDLAERIGLSRGALTELSREFVAAHEFFRERVSS